MHNAPGVKSNHAKEQMRAAYYPPMSSLRRVIETFEETLARYMREAKDMGNMQELGQKGRIRSTASATYQTFIHNITPAPLGVTASNSAAA